MSILNKKDSIKIIIRAIFTYILLFGIIFGSAGHFDYWQGCFLFGNYILIGVIAFILFKDKKELIQERMNPGKGMKWWDKIFFVFFLSFTIATFIIGSLDSGRFSWTLIFPIWINIIGFIIFNLSNATMFLSMLVNPFFSSVVRIQDDRGQTVIKTGPYKFVRHPGYTSGILGIFAIACCLGSIYALIPAGFASITLVIRTYLEDKTLKNELKNYLEYTKEVKYRLFPLFW